MMKRACEVENVCTATEGVGVVGVGVVGAQ